MKNHLIICMLCGHLVSVTAQVTILPSLFICAEDFPALTAWGQPVNGPGTYEITLIATNGNDSILRQTITSRSIPPTNLGQKILCNGDSFVVCGDSFPNSGAYTIVCETYDGCDSLINFSLVVLDPIARIIALHPLCSGAPTTLQSAPSTVGTKTWHNESGQILGMGNSLTIDEPGTYILETSIAIGGITCSERDTVFMPEVPAVSVFTADTSLSCANPEVLLRAVTSDTTAALLWIGPFGFVSSADTIIVTLAGAYNVIATNAYGCSASATATVAWLPQTGTFSLTPNPAQVDSISPASTTVSIPTTIKNLIQDTITVAWKREVFDLTPGCSTQVGDKEGVHADSISIGNFLLAPGEIAPLQVYLNDSDSTLCCGLVRLLCRNTCTQNDTLSMYFIAGCTTGVAQPVVQRLQVFPNPGTGNFQLGLPIQDDHLRLRIIRFDGMLVVDKYLATDGLFTLSDEAPGMYIVLVGNDHNPVIGIAELVLQR